MKGDSEELEDHDQSHDEQTTNSTYVTFRDSILEEDPVIPKAMVSYSD